MTQNDVATGRQIDAPLTYAGSHIVHGWQSIETAPKDRFIFLYCQEDDSRWLAKWQGHRWYGVDDYGLSRQGSSQGDPDVVTGWFVTHWMPLPEPPQ